MDKQEIRKWVLQNAVRYDGKATAGAIVGKLIAADPSVKAKMKDLSKDINEIIKEVNAMKPEAQLKELKKIAPELLEEKKPEEKKRELPELENAIPGKVVTRMPPEPSKYSHIGHAMTFLINYLFAKKYDGKCLLRFEDTNPDKSKQEYVDSIKEDLEWLHIKPDSIISMSDDMELFYKEAERLINAKQAYACTCTIEVMRDLRFKGVACAHRESDDGMDVWKKMLNKEYKQGEVSLRLKGDMTSKNGVMRDPVLFRVDYHKHYKHGEKYCVWPLYDFASVVEENNNGVTHVIRTSEFNLRGELHDFLRKLLRYKLVTVFEYGRFNVRGATTKGREIKQMIDSGEMIGWDDPRLVTLKALQRRGILPETIQELIFDVGLKRDQANIDWTNIASVNRKILDPKANRYFFVDNPVEIEISGASVKEAKLNLHPDFHDRGTRTLIADKKFFITKRDFDKLEDGKMYRLMECMNFTKNGKFKYNSRDIEIYRKQGKGIMHWLPAEHKSELAEVEVLMPDATKTTGYGEPALKKLKVNDMIQLERFGFCRVDKIEGDKVYFWFTHK